ncbi:erkB [Symbiodinium sp. CCMP2456]|nr:erkB [Symbiodinium sp. CCMP2456]
MEYVGGEAKCPSGCSAKAPMASLGAQEDQVWKVKEKETGRIFALKKCFDAFQNSTDAQRTFREIIFLQELNGHENIVRLMHVLKAESSQDLYVMFDFMESDLQRAIAANLLQPIHVEYVTYQILKALKYVHSGGVLHRDLKPANVLLNSNCHVRLCDFGLARTALPVEVQATGRRNSAAADEALPLLTDYVATRWYRAPELLLGSTLYSEGVDMWSVGCILGEMVSGKPILRGRSTMDQLEKDWEAERAGFAPRAHLPKHRCAVFVTRSYDGRPLGIWTGVPDGLTFLVLVLQKPLQHASRKHSAEYGWLHTVMVKSLEDALETAVCCWQEAEPLLRCDKMIRMPISDITKLKASDYRAMAPASIGVWPVGLGSPCSPC